MGDWHRREIADVVRELRTDPGSGLTGAEAASRLRASGPNELPEGPPFAPDASFSPSSLPRWWRSSLRRPSSPRCWATSWTPSRSSPSSS
ncbi:MAG: cation-transporting P-type ATPase [bacterium]